MFFRRMVKLSGIKHLFKWNIGDLAWIHGVMPTQMMIFRSLHRDKQILDIGEPDATIIDPALGNHP